MLCYGPLVSELGAQSAWCPPNPSLGACAPRPPCSAAYECREFNGVQTADINALVVVKLLVDSTAAWRQVVLSDLHSNCTRFHFVDIHLYTSRLFMNGTAQAAI